MQEHYSSDECKESFLEQFEKGTENGKWLAVLWEYDGPQRLTISKTSSNFPTIEYLSALLTLKVMLDKEIDNLFVRKEPLPLAPHLRVDNAIQNNQQQSFENGVYPEPFNTKDINLVNNLQDFPTISPENESNHEPEEEKKSDEENTQLD